MPFLNPHELVGDHQWVYWSDLPMGRTFDFILIDYFKAPVVKKSRGCYAVYYAEAQSSVEELGINIGDRILLFITFRAFVNALNKLPNETRIPCMKRNADGKNLMIRFEKLNREQLKVHTQELREPQQEQVAEAYEQYKMLSKEKDTKAYYHYG